MRLAVILPVYNTQQYLATCLDSLLNQTFKDFCILAVNDASTDDSGQILEDYAKKDQRLRVYHFDTNQGDPAVTQFAMQLTHYMKIDYVARMDADDICLPERFEKQIDYLDKHIDIDVLGSNMYCFSNEQSDKGDDTDVPLTDDGIKVNLTFAVANILNPTSMYRQSTIKPHNINYHQQPTACDYGFWVNCAIAKATFANLPESLVKYRLHEQQASHKATLIKQSAQVFLEKYMTVLFPTLSKDEIHGLSVICNGNGHIHLTMNEVECAFSAYDKIKHTTQSVLGENRQLLLSALSKKIDSLKEVVNQH